MIVWIDGRLTPIDEARIDPRDRGFTLGDGLYETIRAARGRLLRLDRHFARLADGLRLLGFPPIAGDTILADAMRAVLAANGLDEAAIRLTVSRGPAARGIAPDPAGRPTVVAAAAPYAPPAPLAAITATVTRRNQHSPLSRVKSLNCLDAVLARIEASERGAAEAILLNTEGRVAETTAANLFAVIGDALVTPPVGDGALPGVMRADILARLGAEERALTPADLAAAEEIFLTSSLGIRPVIDLDGRPLAAGPAAARAAAVAGVD